jgi:hypothetical protein
MDDERAARLTKMYTSDARDCAVESFDESGRGQARVGADGQTQESSSDIISGFCAYRGNWIIPFVVATNCAFATLILALRLTPWVLSTPTALAERPAKT